jgi:hypothetical protein
MQFLNIAVDCAVSMQFLNTAGFNGECKKSTPDCTDLNVNTHLCQSC